MIVAAALGAMAVPALAAPNGAALSGRSLRMNGDRMTRALNLLEAKGYTNFIDFRGAGGSYEATVTQGGRHFAVRVDPDSQQVTPVE